MTSASDLDPDTALPRAAHARSPQPPDQLLSMPGGLLYPTDTGQRSFLLAQQQMNPSPTIMQAWWADLKGGQRRPRKRAEDGFPYACEWRGPFRVGCQCRGEFGEFRAYELNGIFGLVEDTDRTYTETNVHLISQPLREVRRLRQGPRPRFDLSGAHQTTQGGEAHTTITFTCPKCERMYEQNVLTFGHRQFNEPADTRFSRDTTVGFRPRLRRASPRKIRAPKVPWVVR